MKVLYLLARFFLSGTFGVIAGLASVISLCLVFSTNTNAILIALISFLLFLGIFLYRIIVVLNTYMDQKAPEGHVKFVTYLNYSTIDGEQIIYELHKYIQCKTLIMESYEHEFHWSGSKTPKISSSQQIFDKHIPPAKKGTMDRAVLKFKKPLLYNDFSIIEIKMDVDNSDGKGKSFCGQRITERIQLISFNIELKHLSSNHNARLERKPIGNVMYAEYELILSIPFDEKSRSYRHHLFNPEPNYHYCINWG